MGGDTNNLTGVNRALADNQEHITDELKRRNQDASRRTGGRSTFVTAVNQDWIQSTIVEKELLIKMWW